MTGDAKPSLTDFAKARPQLHSSIPWMEQLPPDVLQQCIDGWKAGMRHTVIKEWLRSIGYTDVTSGRVAWLSKRVGDE